MVTAEEFLKDIRYVTYSGEEKLITFAKLHCIEQAKVISEKTVLEIDDYRTDEYGDEFPIFAIDKDSILNAYDLSLIK